MQKRPVLIYIVSCTTNTIHQIMHFLFDLAECDKSVSEKERKCIFVLGCWMNVNDVTFLKIEADRLKRDTSHYTVLGVKETDTIETIRTHYRKLILLFHPDKHQHLDEAERKKLEVKVLQIREAYEKIKKEKH
jgi:DnaJ like chaperone protein